MLKKKKNSVIKFDPSLETCPSNRMTHSFLSYEWVLLIFSRDSSNVYELMFEICHNHFVFLSLLQLLLFFYNFVLISQQEATNGPTM